MARVSFLVSKSLIEMLISVIIRDPDKLKMMHRCHLGKWHAVDIDSEYVV